MEIIANSWVDLSDRKVGTVLQTVVDHKLATQSISGTAWTDVMSVVITPRYANSKFLIFIKCSIAPNNGAHWGARLVRNGTVIGAGTNVGNRLACMHGGYGLASYNTAGYEPRSANGHWLDSPNTTNQITYAYQVGMPYSTSYNVGINYNVYSDANATYAYRTSSALTVMEIAQ